ncbi:hypothetical protein L6452_00553 [Arctium lappa]|uniref:Uncharacterized protein n=4 Tax=Arctium lappa TaxID=4217 RepID=A0ACB9FF69_ARCLA|nr:hypothetical protein L6452_00545 [Arctium lappa]KAI3769444.1 hypothetical protein L6452_00546 [Arctium lappa]KAI3769450.1 hypothetical protein L6452_00552 [Arctium lappa]KAI3769451.1 hypothetical protein L6452_00553 [Arctium lappa]
MLAGCHRIYKLTNLFGFQLLGGQAKILVFVHVHPDLDEDLETINTLKFIERFSTIEGGAGESGEVRELKEQIALLKAALTKKEGGEGQSQGLRALLEEKFFNSCLIRRYMYNDVLPLRDAQKIFDCSLIQQNEGCGCICVGFIGGAGGNTSPFADDLKNILGSVAVDCDKERIELLLYEVKGKDITELIAVVIEKLASVPFGGGGVAAAAAGGSGAASSRSNHRDWNLIISSSADEDEENDDDDEDGTRRDHSIGASVRYEEPPRSSHHG